MVDRDDIALAQRVIKLNYNQDVLQNDFALYWILSAPFQWHLNSLATGSTALGLKASKLSQLYSVIPPLQEQQEIVNHIHKEEAKILTRFSCTLQTIDLLGERRTVLIAAAVTGQLAIA